MAVCCGNKNDFTITDSNSLMTFGMLMFANELSKNNEKIKELKAENIKLKEENAALKKEKGLLSECFNLSEEMRDYCKEGMIIKLREEIKYLERKISSLKSDLELQQQTNIELIRLIKK